MSHRHATRLTVLRAQPIRLRSGVRLRPGSAAPDTEVRIHLGARSTTDRADQHALGPQLREVHPAEPSRRRSDRSRLRRTRRAPRSRRRSHAGEIEPQSAPTPHSHGRARVSRSAAASALGWMSCHSDERGPRAPSGVSCHRPHRRPTPTARPGSRLASNLKMTRGSQHRPAHVWSSSVPSTRSCPASSVTSSGRARPSGKSLAAPPSRKGIARALGPRSARDDRDAAPRG